MSKGLYYLEPDDYQATADVAKRVARFVEAFRGGDLEAKRLAG